MTDTTKQIALLEQIKRVYANMAFDTIDQLTMIYDDSIQFEDPFRKIDGLANLKTYFGEMYRNIKNPAFHFSNETIAGQYIFLEWVLSFQHPYLNSGKPVQVPGISKLTVTDKIITHRDYFDSAQMLFEQIPVLRFPIRWLKQRI